MLLLFVGANPNKDGSNLILMGLFKATRERLGVEVSFRIIKGCGSRDI